MSILNNSLLLGADAGAAGYQISRSLRFNSSDSAFLSRTPVSSSTDRKASSYSFWMKLDGRDSAGTQGSNTILSCYDGSGPYALYWNFLSGANGRKLSMSMGGASDFGVTFAPSFRDSSAWYHILIVIDTANATPSDRIRLFVNGVRVTDTSSATWPTQNYQPTTFISGRNTNIGVDFTTSYANYFNGYLADIHFIDGQALTPSSFAETNATTGQWVPKAYAGSYGTNGFRLDFSDNSAATATTLGKDRAGSNNWTPNNLSVTAGAGNDSLVDTPTSYGTDTGAGGEVRGNYATWNAIDKSTNVTLSNGNLDTLHGGAGHTKAVGNVYVSSGKWYSEFTLATVGGNVPVIGINSITLSNRDTYVGSESGSFGYSISALKYSSATPAGTGYGATFGAGDVIGIALDLDAGTLVFYKNGVSQGTAFTGLSGTFTFAASGIGSSASWVANFGQRPFAYTAPSGFKALCDTNLPAPVVDKPNSVFDVALWTGNGSARSITGLNFNPDFVWIKGRSGATDHALYDAVRGATIDLASNSTAAETTQTQGLTAFNSDGFSLGTLAKVNTNTATYAGWAWDAGSSTVTNTQGSITSQVRANASAGFSIVTYSQGASNSTVGHGLGVAPHMIIAKSRTSASGRWDVYHRALGREGYIYLDGTQAAGIYPDYWGTSGITSTTFGLSLSGNFNNLGNMVAYCFAPVAGYSAFGSYTGNGSADGPFVFTGMLSRWIMLKRTDTTGNWTIIDTAREGYNVDNDPLYPNLADAEGTTDLADILSNGFKLRTTDASVNASAGTYVYACFASNPFSYSRAR